MSPFHHRGLECKSRSQETSGVTGKFGLVVKKKKKEAEERQTVLPRERTGHSNTLFQHKRRLYTWISPDGQH